MFNKYGSEKQYHHSNIHSGIPIPSIKYVLIIPNEHVKEHRMKNKTIYSWKFNYRNIKGHKSHTFIKSHVKDKYALLSYQNISPRISTEISTKKQSDEGPSQEYLDIMVLSLR